jgi:hypothetical protein
MNKIAIVGHPASGYRDVEALLNQCGMRPPLPSRRDGLLPHDITATLCKAHKAPPVDVVADENEITQIQAGPVWHGMALDLMLGNLDQDLWGWADPQAIHTLDYWRELDPKLTFVLVYDEPHRVLAQAARSQGDPPTAQDLQRLLDNWVAYNGALLRFHLRHPQRSQLVHAQQVRRAADRYLQQLQPLLDAPLTRLPGATDQIGVTQHALAPAGSALLLPDTLVQAVSAAGLEPQVAAQRLSAEAAERYLIDGVLANHPQALQLYAELQSAANLPTDPAARLGPQHAMAAWETLVRQRAFMAELLAQLNAQHQRKTGEWENARTLLEHARTEQTQENERLVSQLHQVQEELERQVRAARETQETGKHKALSEENELLLSQLHQVQEELERYYLENQRLKQKVPPPKPPGPYGAADRIKRQLSYRLGTVMIQRSRSLGGWFGMPWALAAEAKAFRADLAQRQADKKAPPIHKYRDAHEAERVKQHLSYRLGSTLIQHGKSPLGWLKLPFALSREVRQFRTQRKGT